MTRLASIADIQREVAAHYSLPVETMQERDGEPGARLWTHAHPRQLAMCLAHRLSMHSLSRIGQLFGRRDHSTVFAGIVAAERRIANDDDTRKAARLVTKRVLTVRGLL